MSRYTHTFAQLAAKKSGAFVPFLMLGDPSPAETLALIRTVIQAGADALELGLPFSDPVADGPTVAAAHLRALAHGITLTQAFAMIAQIRTEFPTIPIGLLAYANIPYTFGLTRFYQQARDAGVDSVLLPDVPVRESQPFINAAQEAGIDPIFIAPARASAATLAAVAAHARGYIYAISRDGVTGTEREATTIGLANIVNHLQQLGAAPVLLGFGIATPAQVAAAIAAGARGVITGSALLTIIEKHLVSDPHHNHANHHGLPAMNIANPAALNAALRDFIRPMKAATYQPS